MKPWVQSLTPILEKIIGDLHNPDNSNHVAALAKQLGEDKTNSALHAYVSTLDDFNDECLIHAGKSALVLLHARR